MAALRAFAHGFAAGRYGAMWAWLAPAAHTGWGGPAGFAAYYRAKFAPVRLLGLRFGTPWVAGRVVQAQGSLDLAWRGTGVPGVLSLFQNLEATIVQTPQGWRVAEGGPLNPAAPVIPPPRVAPRVRRVPILVYRHISSAPPAPAQARLTITDADRAAQLAYLKGHGYHAVLLVDLFNALYYGRPLPPHPVVLTFDDGYLDAYTDAFPLLRRYGMVGEFNIITGFVGETVGLNRYMTWPQIVAMADAGMEMESHTIDHQDLGIINALQDAYELRFSRAVLAAHLHRAVQFLAFPSGEPFRSGTVAAQQRLLALLPQFGYVGDLLDPPAPRTLQDARTPYQLPRVRVDPGESLAAFAARLRS
jgi:peptidoglycan/xylan/chitin deacetylase (PgdA/CDA1 family)